MLPIAACALGIYLGLNLNVLVLISVTLGMLAAFGTWGSWAGQGLIDGLATAVVEVVLCQAGYMLGLTARQPLVQLLVRLKFRQSKRI